MFKRSALGNEEVLTHEAWEFLQEPVAKTSANDRWQELVVNSIPYSVISTLQEACYRISVVITPFRMQFYLST